MEELDLKELFNLFWRKKVQIILIVLIFIILGVTYTIGFTKPMYTSKTSMILTMAGSPNKEETAITTTDVTLNSKLVSTYSEIIKRKAVLSEVIANLKLDTNEKKLEKCINVASVKDTELIEIAVTTEIPDDSAKIANEIAKVFTDKIKQYYNIENVQIVDVAEKDEKPSNINHKKDVAIFAVIGIVVAAAYVLILNMLDSTVKTPDDIEKELKLTVLSAIPICDTELQKNKKRGGKRK